MELGKKITDMLKGLFESYFLVPFKLIQGSLNKLLEEHELSSYRALIEHSITLKHLEMHWEITPVKYKEIPELKQVYKARKDELTAMGMKDTEDIILGFLGRQIANAVWGITTKALPKVLEWLDTIAVAYHIRKEELEALKKLAQAGEFGLNAVVGFVLGVTLYPAINSASAPIWRKSGQMADVAIRSEILSPIDLIRSYWRGFITEDYLKLSLQKHGYSDDDIKTLRELAYFYPTPTELVTWQAREVYEPEFIKKYGLEDELELVKKEPFYKAGITDEQIKNFWVAHWTHPPWTVIIEMLHRGLITEKDVYEWFRVVEIPPYWRERYTKIAYIPFTRVDTRRMYKLGVLAREDVKRTFLNLGYDDWHAEKMTQFTIQYETEENRDLTKTEILKLYEIGAITKQDTAKYLMELNYDEREASYLLSLTEYKISKQELDDKIAVLREEFLTGLITEPEFTAGLDALNLTASFRERIVISAIRTKLRMLKMPTIKDITTWYGKKQITEDKAIKILKAINVPEDFIPLYLGKKA